MQEALTNKVQFWLDALNTAFEDNDARAASLLFEEEGYWRDLVSLTWNIKTMEGREAIERMLESTMSQAKPTNFMIEDVPIETDGIIESWLTFDTLVARGRGHLRLRDGKAFTLLTTMVELKGYEEALGDRRINGVEHGVAPGRKNWQDKREEEKLTLGYKEQPYCLIVGGGQGGVALGARMRMLNVPTLIIDKHERPGDSWRKRYKSLCLHDPVWYDHLPYIPFPEHWPVFSPKDKIGDWLEMYTHLMELNYWGSTLCKSASYDDIAEEWTVIVERKGQEVVLKPRQLVLATGMSSKPNLPTYSGQADFKGEIQHSSQHPGPEGYRGKKVVVVGSNNSAHDICAALYEQGADATMIQRSSTHVSRAETLFDLTTSILYSEEAVAKGIDHNKADLIFASVPYKIMPDFHRPAYEEMARRDRAFYERLEQAGFMLDFGEDGSGLFMKYLRRGSGYYIDVGASGLIADGKIKLKSGVSIEQIKEHSILFNDGSELPADLIVFATGYASMNGWAADLIDQETADKVGKCWGLGSNTAKDPGPWEGELRNMWKPTQQPGLWFHGGNLHQSRHYSQFLSLQIKARMEGIETPVYELAESHHVS